MKYKKRLSSIQKKQILNGYIRSLITHHTGYVDWYIGALAAEFHLVLDEMEI
jgi:hypothetical protein